ncbi:taurine dioxygenase [Streptomyces dangxiongensis]|uniref:Taurine dioxygenase n=1 Tax=Streptomyces dangxiongensis TaxID=1442032 RepID=A0A3G2JLA7_9ACTN|nr:TauD/TfdA family dioxygenase [Streptomyces dangxiongensis]AYN43228.1 taurine dioxygenase [Streptomyces dangxiongensis]
MEKFVLEAVEHLTTRPRKVYQTITADPLTPVIGAEITGVDLSRELSDQQFEDIGHAFLEHHVLVFRDQVLTAEDHKRFAARFGELRPLPVAVPEGRDPVILEISADKDSTDVDGHGWHADGTSNAELALGSMLYVTRTPDVGSGGDTMFANMHLAYEMLSPPMRAFLDGLTAVHDDAVAWQGHIPPAGYVLPRNEHPVVVRHPETGRKLLFVNPAYTSHIVQLSGDESKALLGLLFDLVARKPMLSCRVRWTPHTLVFWDNRSVQHHAVWDYYPHARHGRRVAIKGRRPEA